MGKREAVRRRTFAEILETAGRMAEAEGWRAVTIRRIAAEIGYSTPVIYQHFPSKEAVLHTLLGQANGELAERMRAAVVANRHHGARTWRRPHTWSSPGPDPACTNSSRAHPARTSTPPPAAPPPPT